MGVLTDIPCNKVITDKSKFVINPALAPCQSRKAGRLLNFIWMEPVLRQEVAM